MMQMKYAPPGDEDETFEVRLARRREAMKDQPTKERVTLPMTVRCSACGSYMYKGRRLNSRKYITGETCLGIQIFRFSFRCHGCSAEIVYREDPQNSGYTMESGAIRIFKPRCEADNSRDEPELERARGDIEALDISSDAGAQSTAMECVDGQSATME